MANRSALKRDLLEPNASGIPDGFGATLDAHGLYSTTEFVLRLSPRIHELVDALTRGDTAEHSPGDLFQAYSTFLHETLHWWQHMGSTTGLIYSLCYPASVTANLEQLSTTLREIGPRKSLKRWAERFQIENPGRLTEGLKAANAAVNNALDIGFYKKFLHSPLRAPEIFEDPYFMSVGHAYRIAYGDTVQAIIETCDLSADTLPDPTTWQERFDGLAEKRHENFYLGSPTRRAKVGIHGIFEGQARFSQLQFLARAGGPVLLADYAAAGQFDGVYGAAFQAFLTETGQSWPERITDPEVALFLLICDLAINPTRGVPFDFGVIEDFIIDVDPGARFTRLCGAAKAQPELARRIIGYTDDDYWVVARELTGFCGYDDPKDALDQIAAWPEMDPAVARLMTEHATFEYADANHPIRVMVSHFIAFSADKRDHPAFFCWPGMALAGDTVEKTHQDLFLRHLSLFSDRAESQQIFVRDFPGKAHGAAKRLLDRFYSSLIMYELALQWILEDGPFRYEFQKLTGRPAATETREWVERQFISFFGVAPSEFGVD